MALANVPSGKDLPNDINVIIEIPADSDPVKYEVDKDTGAVFVDRFMGTAMHYKDLEPGKWVRIDGWVGIEEAKAEIMSSIERFQEAPDKPAF